MTSPRRSASGCPSTRPRSRRARRARCPGFVARIAAGRLAVYMMTGLQGATNAKAKRELGWEPHWQSWRQGFREALG